MMYVHTSKNFHQPTFEVSSHDINIDLDIPVTDTLKYCTGEVRPCDPFARVRPCVPCVPCVSRLPPVSFLPVLILGCTARALATREHVERRRTRARACAATPKPARLHTRRRQHQPIQAARDQLAWALQAKAAAASRGPFSCRISPHRPPRTDRAWWSRRRYRSPAAPSAAPGRARARHP